MRYRVIIDNLTSDKEMFIESDNLLDLIKKYRNYIEKNQIGASMMLPRFGEIYENNEKLGVLSYNGRFWDLEGNEVLLE